MFYTNILLTLFASLSIASALVTPIRFDDLQSSTTQKVVIFHDPNNEGSIAKLHVLEALDAAGTYGSEYEYVFCDVTLPPNVKPVANAGFKEFPGIFTQTKEGGIEPYGGDFTAESFATFHEFRMVDLTENNVQRMKDSNGVGGVDGVEGLLTLSADRPVFVKMYEVTPPTQILEYTH